MGVPGLLTARPHPIHAHPVQPGIHALERADGLVYVPEAYRPEEPMPLIVMLHGAGGDALQSIRLMRHVADGEGTLLLAPKSRGATWDLQTRHGLDTPVIDGELHQVFSRYAVDREHVAVAGFSDGASFALSLGLSNGELFSAVLAFSPGYMAPDTLRGKPRLHLTHGTADHVLNIDLCSRALVTRLRASGYAVEYREFDGGHAVPPEVVTRAARWFLHHS